MSNERNKKKRSKSLKPAQKDCSALLPAIPELGTAAESTGCTNTRIHCSDVLPQASALATAKTRCWTDINLCYKPARPSYIHTLSFLAFRTSNDVALHRVCHHILLPDLHGKAFPEEQLLMLMSGGKNLLVGDVIS